MLRTTFVFITVLAANAQADPAVELSGSLFTGFQKALGSGDDTNAFTVDRAYITARARLDDRFALRITTDVDALRGGEDTKVRPFLKYAYIEMKTAPNLRLRFGMSGNGWTGYADQFSGTRFIAKSFADRRDLLPSADIGVHALGSLLSKRLNLQASLVNGEGYDVPELNGTKSAQLRASYDLLTGTQNAAPISLFIARDLGGPDAASLLLAASSGWRHAVGTFWAEYCVRQVGTERSEGWSVAAMPALGKYGNAVLRYDRWSLHDGGVEDVGQTLLTGVSKSYRKKVKFALMFQSETRANEDATQQVSVHMQAGF
jgi:hypothetical protein